MQRRKFIYKSVLGLTIPIVGGLYSWMIEPFWVEIVKRKMTFEYLPESLIGLSLMQISDIHLEDRFPQKYLYNSMDKARKLDPDIVVYTGDYITYESQKQIDDFELFSKSLVKGKKETIAILGNHDYGINYAQNEVGNRVAEILESVGIRVLRNEIFNLDGLQIIGLDDYWGPNFNPNDVMKKVKNSEPSLTLVHNPDVCDAPIWDGYSGWVLSGHTHGGQVKPPFLPPPMLPVKNKMYSAGEIDLGDGRTLYINRALGHLWQVRMNVRPEITVFKLRIKD